MIMEPKTAHKVPAISTSEDSQEVYQPSSSSDYRNQPAAKENGVADDTAMEESREMGETSRAVHKPPMDRDEATPSSNGKDDPDAGVFASFSRDGSKRTTTDAQDAMSVELESEKQALMDPVQSSDAVKAPHHSLLPSLSASFDPVMDGQPWSQSFNNNGGIPVSKEKHTPKPKHRSPATTFPLPSPKSSYHQAEYGDDEASFNLFNQSFDTMSDTANYLREMHHTESGNRENGDQLSPNFSMLGSHQHRRETSSNMDLSLPALSQYVNGNLSPMPSYSEDGGHGRSFSGMEPIPVHFPSDDEEAAPAAAHAHGYTDYADQGEASATNPYGGSWVSNPFFVLRCARQAFSNCTFLFSCLATSDPCAVNVSENGSFQHLQGNDNQTYHESMDPHELTIASRRVGAAICAFGGSVKPKQGPRTSSIFRPKGNSSDKLTDTGKLVSHQAYEERLRHRYQLNGNHISWDVEENPPIDSSDANQSRNDILAHMNTNESYTLRDNKAGQESSSRNSLCKSGPYASVVEMTSNGTKMKYRCKLCGQPKQNHNCPYRQSMQRSLGVTVHPAVNSFTAYEPGALTVPLSEMNNFVSYDSDYGSSESTRMTSTTPGTGMHRRSHATITPETFGPPQSTSPSPHTTTLKTTAPVAYYPIGNDSDNNGSVATRKRSHSEMGEVEVNHDRARPFIEEVQLFPEQYRAVTQSKNPAAGAFEYPSIELTFSERKKLSDTLFVLSREIPNLTEECSSILSEARTKDSWDLAVAELLTQLAVGLYCQEGDRCLDGLQHYLLHLGISC